MGSSSGTSEIIESGEEFNFWNHFNRPKLLHIKLREGEGKSRGYPIEDDLHQLIEAIDLRMSPRILGYSHQVTGDTKKNDIFKRPIRGCALQASGIGTSESVMMKQALRRLCIMQASEQAAIKRSSKQVHLSGVSEAGTIKRLYTSMILEENRCGLSVDKRKMNFLKLSIVPESPSLNSSHKGFQACDSCHIEFSQLEAVSSPNNVISKPNLTKKRIKNGIASLPKAVSSPRHASSMPNATKNTNIDVIAPLSTSSLINVKTYPKDFKFTLEERIVLNKHNTSPQVAKTTVRNNFPSMKGRQAPLLLSASSNRCANVEPSQISIERRLGVKKDNVENNCHCNPKNCSLRNATVPKLTKSSRLTENGDCSQTSMSNFQDNSSGTSNSDESNQCYSCAYGVRPHMPKDMRWMAIRYALNQYKGLELTNFKLVKKLGCGDIGTVYLAELIGSKCLFALKVMDVKFLISRKKILRAQTERNILRMLDHPFLPTLFADFTSDNLLCFVIEYCPGGDLHVLRQRQPGRRFSEPEASFYVAEVLLALEYLHMLGVIYRDLKPENILVREDGHIMLSDFDLSLRCIVNPTLLRSSSVSREEVSREMSGPCAESSCINPHCLHPSWPQISCFTPRVISSSMKNPQKMRPDATLQLVAEPTDARSNSFVGTHEYLAPEIIKGDGHGSAVDWWTFGIFLYELLYGRTPFKGSGNEETLANVVSQSLKFPETPVISLSARDLIERLLVKDPDNRLGSVKGAFEIKRHPFFEGLNWALIRCVVPPEVPGTWDLAPPFGFSKSKEGKITSYGKNVEFELF